MRLLTSLLALLLLYSCSDKPAPWETGRVVIAGKVRNIEKYPDRRDIGLQFNSLLKQEGRNSLNIPVDEQGNFRTEIQLGYPQEVLMKYRMTHHLCLNPGDSLYIDLNADIWNDSVRGSADREELVSFTGTEKAAELNRAMSNLQHYYQPLIRRQEGEESLNDAIRKYPPKEFETFVEKRNAEYKAVWDQYRKESSPATELTPWVEDLLRYQPWNLKLVYVNILNSLRAQNPEAKIPEIPENFTRFLKDYDPNDNRIVTIEHATFLDMYDQYTLSGIYEDMDKDTLLRSNEDALKFLLKQLDEKSSGFTNELLRCKFYLEMLPNAPADILNEYIRPEQFSNAYLREKVQESSNQLTALRNAEPEEGMELIKPDSTIREGLFDSIVSKYAGKVVYVDFWAPWCSPCLEEMPFSLELQQRYQGQDVVFVYLCGQSSDDSWRTTVISEKITGMHYKPSSEQVAALYKEFGIEGIPHYMLIDKQGKIVSANAPRPSETDRIAEEIDKLL